MGSKCNHISILKGSQEDETWVILSVKYHFSQQGNAGFAEYLYIYNWLAG